jgi:hypothetical protein
MAARKGLFTQGAAPATIFALAAANATAQANSGTEVTFQSLNLDLSNVGLTLNSKVVIGLTSRGTSSKFHYLDVSGSNTGNVFLRRTLSGVTTQVGMTERLFVFANLYARAPSPGSPIWTDIVSTPGVYTYTLSLSASAATHRLIQASLFAILWR